MKVLMLNYEFPPIGGGSANAMYYLLKEFSKYNDLQIDVITSSPKRFHTEKFSKNITLYRLDVSKKSYNYQTFRETLSWCVQAFFFMRKLTKKSDYDFCHCWSAWPSGFFGFINKMPYIIALRGSDVPGFNPRFKIADKLFFSHYSKLVWEKAYEVTANSIGLKKLAQKTWDGDISVICNGIDTEQFRPKEKPHSGKIILLTVSRLIKRKGVRYIIRAMPDILKKHKSVELHVIGDGPEKADLMKLAEKLGVKSSVKFIGYVQHNKLPRHYQGADIFILPSQFEGMSNTILEAMACGLPVITTNTGGTKELINDNGIVIRKYSMQDIADAVIKLIGDKATMQSMSQNSRKIALDYSWKAVAEQYHKLYKEVSD
jgi:glycosyltransferase involved in cell wall biosynthesis